jgi:hypothetical protein
MSSNYIAKQTMQLPALFSFVSAASAMAIKANAPAPGTGALVIDSVFPTANGSDTVVWKEPKRVTGVFDRMVKRYDRGVACTGQVEGLDKDAVFLVEAGHTPLSPSTA